MTQQDNSGHVGEAMAVLSEKKQATIAHLLAGKTISKISREMDVSRNTIYTWRNKDPIFQQALSEEKARRLSNHTGTGDEAESFREVQAIPLLSLAGIRVRIELHDRLILQDLAERDTNRAVLIRRLESSIKQANDFLGKISADDIAREMVEQQTMSFRQAVLEAALDIIGPLPHSDKLLAQFRGRLDDIDRESGVSES